MKISIIIPCYNVENYIRRGLDSIISQTYEDWEGILVDDGSNDSTLSICEDYSKSDTRFKVFHKINGGVSSARNLGIDNATGDIICFFDPDDWFSIDALEIIADVFKDSRVDGFEYQFEWAYGDNVLHGELNREADVKLIDKHENIVNHYFKKIDWTQDDLDYWFDGGNIWERFFPFGMCRFAFRRTLIEKFHIRLDTSKKVYEDKDFILRSLFECHVVCVTQMRIYAYFMNPDSATHRRITFHDRLVDKCLLFDSYKLVRENNNLFDSFPYYFGALVISCLSLLPKIEKFSDVKDYCNYVSRSDVQQALTLVDLSKASLIKKILLRSIQYGSAPVLSCLIFVLNKLKKSICQRSV